MSLPFLPETAAEVHRLAIAGSGLAAGDYRLKKLIPSLEGLAAKAPIFGRIAQSVTAVTDETDPAAAGRALLDLSSLLTAIQYTQSPYDFPGDLEPVPSSATTWAPTTVTHRSLSAVIEALVSRGEGRLEILRDAHERGLFKDLRLMQPAVGALHDNYGELSTYVAEEVLPQFGAAVIPLLMEGFDPRGGRPHARRITALCALDPAEGRAVCRRILPEATKEVKVAVVAGLTGSAEDVDTLLDMTKEKAQEVRHAAIRSLKGLKRPDVLEFLRTGVKGKDGAVVAQVAVASGDQSLTATVRESFFAAFEDFAGVGKTKPETVLSLLDALQERPSEATRAMVATVFEKCLSADKVKQPAIAGLTSSVAGALLELNDPEADKVVLEAATRSNLHVSFSLTAAGRLLDAEAIFDLFSPALGNADSAATIVRMIGSGYHPTFVGVRFRIPRLPPEKISPRWLDASVDADAQDLVVRLARPGHNRALEYLRAKDHLQERSLKATGAYTHQFAEAICRLIPDAAPGLLISRLKAIQRHHANSGMRWAIYSDLRRLPVTAIPEIEKMADQFSGTFREELDEVIAELRHQATNSSTVTS